MADDHDPGDEDRRPAIRGRIDALILVDRVCRTASRRRAAQLILDRLVPALLEQEIEPTPSTPPAG